MTRIPGDLDRPDQFLFGLTGRQLLLITPAFGLIALLGWSLSHVLPVYALMPILAVLTGVAVSTVLIKQDGMSPDRLAGVFVRYLRSPRTLVWAPEGTPAVPARLRILQRRSRNGNPSSVAEFKEPWQGFRNGDIELGDGSVRLLAVSSLDLQLRSDKETRVLTEGFARLLNSLDAPLSVIVRGEPIDLEHAASAAEQAGASQHNEATAAYGADHAEFLRSMSGGLRRQVYIVVHGNDADQLDARCEEILTLLVPFGIRATRVEGSDTVSLLARATGGVVPQAGQASPGEPVRGETVIDVDS